jgi:hypothetical protein
VKDEKVSERFELKYAGSPSQFQGKSVSPEGTGEAKLRIVAVDVAGNTGQHTISYKIMP